MPVEIFVYDPIGPAWAGMVDAKTFIDELTAAGVQDVTIRVNSPGGDVFMANAMFNAIDRHPGKVTVQIDGLAASAASYFILAANEVVAAKNSLIMIHKPMSFTWGNSTEHQKTIDVLDKAESTLLAMYSSKTGKDTQEIADALAKETWFTAQEAMDWGLVDRVGNASSVTAQIPEGLFNNAPQASVVAPIAIHKRKAIARSK